MKEHECYICLGKATVFEKWKSLTQRGVKGENYICDRCAQLFLEFGLFLIRKQIGKTNEGSIKIMEKLRH